MDEHEHDEAKQDDGGQTLASFGDDAGSGKPSGETMGSDSVSTDATPDAGVQPVTTHRQGDDGTITHD